MNSSSNKNKKVKETIPMTAAKPLDEMDHGLIMHISGDCMEPTLCAGDKVFIDPNDRKVNLSGGLYCITSLNDNIPFVRRLQRSSQRGRIRVICDSEKYSNQEVASDDIAIVGKIIGFARRFAI